MNSPTDRLEAIFTSALAQADPGARELLLQRECGGEPSLLSEVRALLAAHEQAAGFLDLPLTPEVEAALARLKPEQAGDRIGHYKLLQQIGEGGFGIVWMAEQEAPLRRRVALKIIKLGLDSKEVIARFEQERQALAAMDHPHIAKVFDAGATPHGRPYFAMELVRGIKITDYCDQARLSTAERIRLLVAVCQAMQHAHQKGIIHRDLKPSNILVTLHDGVPIPKVIDFGVAKATQNRLTDLTLFTQFQQMIGTPIYMSPEQAEMSGLDIDTRSDIYSLGVLLYELLVGRTPFTPEAMRQASYDEIRRIIREEEPARPSKALTTMAGATLTTVAQQRASEAPKLIQSMRGDLDWVVMKALEKDRTRRYATAESLAADLLRHLHDEPVLACPPTAVYRLQKFVRRHRTPVIAGMIVGSVLMLALALVSTAYVRVRGLVRETNGAYQDRLAADGKQSDLRQELERMKTTLRAQAEEQATATRFWHEFIAASHSTPTDQAALRQAAIVAAAQALQDFKLNQSAPESLREASLCQLLGDVFWQLGDYDKAEEMLRKARAQRVGYLTGSDRDDLPLVAETLYRLAVVLRAQGKVEEAETVGHQILDLARPATARLDSFPARVADTLNLLGLLHRDRHEWPEAEARHREALAAARRAEPGGGWRTVRSLRYLGSLFQDWGHPATAEPFLQEAETIADRLPADREAGSLLDPGVVVIP